MWKELEDKLSNIEGKDLQKELLTDLDFILDNFGQPKQYYDSSNEKLEEINAAIDRLVLTHRVVFAEDKEGTVKRLYTACSGKETNGREYKLFYVCLWDSLNIWHYGETVSLGPNSFGPYTSLKNRLRGIRRVLETGRIPDIQAIPLKYTKELGKQPEGQYI